jgi:uncharacterized membrane protein YuzA (DUF378 family)
MGLSVHGNLAAAISEFWAVQACNAARLRVWSRKGGERGVGSLDPWTVAYFLLVFPGLLALGLLWIQYQDFRTRNWRKVEGRIVESRSEAREVRKVEHQTLGSGSHTDFIDEEKIETRNFARVSYEFSVDGAPRIGSRIDQGVDSGNSEVAAALRKYPKGKIVSVFYDPSDPEQSILARADAGKIWAGWFAVVVLVGLIFTGVLGVDRFNSIARAVIPRSEYTPLVVALTGFALVIMAFAHMLGKKGREMAKWPRTSGEITNSAVATTLRWDNSTNVVQTLYLPRVVYSFVVAGDSFEGDNIGAVVSASTPASAEKTVARFPLGAKVDVFYDPGVPTESTLNRSVGFGPAILWFLAAAFLFGALTVAGLLPFV